ncbi:MAG: hypothetical protein K2N63_17860 [Lachnospiraceae bacterium]|nr:hypothetical protein [Lachnospiraceae bacterium]
MKKKILAAFAGIMFAGALTAAAFLGNGRVTAVADEPAADSTQEKIPIPDNHIGSSWKAADSEAAGLGYTYLAMENNRVAFYVNESGNIGVKDKANGEWYLSVPTEEARDADPLAKAVNKMNLGSDYQVVFVDQNGATSAKNTLAGVVNKENVRITESEGSLKVWYYFEDMEVGFSIQYALTEDGFTVSLPFADFIERIDEGRTAQDRGTVSYWGIRSVSVLPYFGAAGLSDEGYILIPDGSGALINFNNQKAAYGAYSQDVYGRDPVLILDKNLKTAKNVLMPVFGASFGDHGFFATAEAGGASVSVNALSSGTITSFNNVYMQFRYRQTMSATRSVANSYGGNSTLGSTVVVDNKFSGDCYRLRYFLLEEEEADYVGMAKCYRDYLISQGLTKKESAKEAPLYLTLYGGIEDTDYFLGIPYKTVKPFTTYKQAQQILEELVTGGVDQMAVRYLGWQDGGLNASVPTKVKFEGKLGGKKAYQSLVDYAAGEGIKLFPEVDFLNLYQSGTYSIHSDAIQAATHDTAYQYTYDPNTGNKQEENRWQMLTPKLSMEAFTKLVKQKDKLVCGNLSLGALGGTLYSDFTARKNAIHRDDTMALWSLMVQDAKQEFNSVMVDTGNIYAAIYADYISGVTTESTHFNLTDVSVPFYQIVMHGYASYSTEPVNLTPDPLKAVLKALETGSSLEFSLIFGDAHELVKTRYNYLYNASFAAWSKRIAEYYNMAAPVLTAVAGNEITGHAMLSDNVYRTDYGAVGSVYVNYGKKDVTVDGVTVPAKNFVFQEGKGR